jgi:hypothetical protein
VKVMTRHGLAAPVVAPATAVVVYNSHGEPIAAVVEYDADQVWVGNASEPHFREAMRSLGIDAAPPAVEAVRPPEA